VKSNVRRDGSLIRYRFCRAMYRQPAITPTTSPASSRPKAISTVPVGWNVDNTTINAHTSNRLKMMIRAER
jgi:hypothetical protein